MCETATQVLEEATEYQLEASYHPSPSVKSHNPAQTSKRYQVSAATKLSAVEHEWSYALQGDQQSKNCAIPQAPAP